MIDRPPKGNDFAPYFAQRYKLNGLEYSVYCEDCPACWASDGEIPDKHHVIDTYDVMLYTQSNNYCKQIIYVSCKQQIKRA